MTLRDATPADLDAIMAIEMRSFPTDAWSAETMAAELVSPHGRYLVDEVGGVVVGYGGVRALPGGADADIQTIALDADHRGSGRGRMLLHALLLAARERGAREMFLEVRADNPVAERLYLSEGFAEIGRRPRYYQPDDVDAIVMRLDLAAWSNASGPSTSSGTEEPWVAELVEASSAQGGSGPSTSSGAEGGSGPSTSSGAEGGSGTESGSGAHGRGVAEPVEAFPEGAES